MADLTNVHTLDGSIFKFEDLTEDATAATWVAATVEADQDLKEVKITSSASLANGGVVEIRGSDKISGLYFITNQDRETQLQNFYVVNTDAEKLGITAAENVEIRIVDMSNTCRITGGNVELGSVNTNTVATNCGVITVSASKENGTMSLDFLSDLENKTQFNLLKEYEENYDRAFAILLHPKNCTTAIGFIVKTTGLTLNFDENFTMNANFALTGKVNYMYLGAN